MLRRLGARSAAAALTGVSPAAYPGLGQAGILHEARGLGEEGLVATLFIDGEWQPAAAGGQRDVVDPFDASLVQTVDEATREDSERAIAAARRAFDSGVRPGTPVEERAGPAARRAWGGGVGRGPRAGGRAAVPGRGGGAGGRAAEGPAGPEGPARERPPPEGGPGGGAAVAVSRSSARHERFE